MPPASGAPRKDAAPEFRPRTIAPAGTTLTTLPEAV
jgi:hypothetical protein